MNKHSILHCVTLLGLMQQEMDQVGSVEDTEAHMNSLMGMEDLENMSFDDVEENPGFITPPVGIYTLFLDKATMKTRKNKKGELQRRINHVYKITQTHELEDPSAKPPSDNALIGLNWQVTAEGLGYWKPHVKAIMGEKSTAGLSVGATVKVLDTGGFSFKAKLTHRTSKGEDGKDYINVNIQVLENNQEVPDGAV